jgi:phenylalanyl-tRNA synthetase alpha chain
MDKNAVASLHPLERKVLPHLKQTGSLGELAKAAGLQEVEAMRALQWLANKGIVEVETDEQQILVIKDKGKAALKEGLPEQHVIALLKKKKELPVSEIAKALPKYDKGAVGPVTGKLKKLGIPFITTKDGKPAFKWVNVPIKENPVEKLLANASKHGWKLVLTKEQAAAAKDLLKRQGYAELVKHRGKNYTTKMKLAGVKLTKKYDERLTPGMLKTGEWKKKTFRPYNVEINVPKKSGGRAHFVNEAINYIKKIWLDFGFQEMSGNHVQTGFWDLDSLFVPQDHPAREMQDTFYIEDPASGTLPKDVHTRVKAAHENGGDTGSLGWRYTYSDDEAKKNMLRTHTTVLSAQTLDKIKKGQAAMPGKYFSVNTVYRNEALDWKHLFEFLQVEGIVVGEDANFSNLKAYLKEFFAKMGFPDVRIRPGHFPYTEPSAEVDVWDPRKNEWVELGGSGIFRPEVTKTLIGKEIPVLAWGLGMERIITRYYDIKDLRDIYNNDIEQLKNIKAWLA